MSIRSVFTSAAAAFGIACSSSAFAGTVFIHAAYVPTAIVYAPPPPRPLYVPAPAYVVPATVTVVLPAPQKPVPYAVVPIPVVVPVAVPAQNVAYA
ncbi:MAG TPA: hypothetical protein VGL08_10685 [Paraburkholderia sp.]